MHPHLPVRYLDQSAVKLIEGHMDGCSEMAGGPLVVSAHVEDHEVVAVDSTGQFGEACRPV